MINIIQKIKIGCLKKTATLALFFFVLFSPNAYGLDWVFHTYFPSLLSHVAGDGSGLYQLQETVEATMIQPFEFKFLTATLGPLALSTNGAIAFYTENSIFASLNLSLGVGFSSVKEDKSPLQGWFLALYPVYAFPVFTDGKTPIFAWKSALDLGIGFNFLSTTDIYITLYSRMLFYWNDVFYPFGVVPDFGITLGWHFQDKMFIDEYMDRSKMWP